MRADIRPLLIGNWKLNHTRSSAREFFKDLLVNVPEPLLIDVAIAPVAPMLELVSNLIEKSAISLAAQDVYFMEGGAYTGQWSVANLKELGVKYCLVGHSERRRLFGETDDDVAKKTAALIKGGVTPVACVGETLEEREAGHTCAVLQRQISAITSGLDAKKGPLVLAYEPVWAIGTGQSATKEAIEEAHAFLREQLQSLLGPEGAYAVRILYGGSVTPQNIGEFMPMPNVDGALVGGASLQVLSFLSMLKELQSLRAKVGKC